MTKKLEESTSEELIYKLLADKIGSVDPEHVFYAKSIDSGKDAGKVACLIGGKKISANQASNLTAEAMMLEKMLIWKLFTETLRHEAQLRMFEKSKTTEDMNWGKAILHAIGIFETIVKSIQNAHVDEPPKSVVHSAKA